LGYIRLEHRFGTCEYDSIGAGVRDELLSDKGAKEFRIAVLVPQILNRDCAQFHTLQSSAKRREVNLVRRFLAVDYAMLLHVECNQRDAAYTRVVLD
jgi:hypothetical protein